MTSSGRSHRAFFETGRGGGDAKGGSSAASGAIAASSSAAPVLREPGTDLARVLQRAVLVDADEERPEIDRGPGAARPATDHELLLGSDLDLLPGHRALPRKVRRAAVLGHDPLETARLGRFEEGDPLPRDVLAEPHARIGAKDVGQESATDLEGFVEQRPPVEKHQVEDLVHEGVGGATPRRGP